MLVYNPLMEDDDSQFGWDKETVTYTKENKEAIKKKIMLMGIKSNYKIQHIEADDIYEKLLLFFYSSQDYSLEKAYEQYDETERVSSFDNFINKCIGFCIKRYVSNRGEYEKQLVKNVVYDVSGNETSIFELIGDGSAEATLTGVLDDDFDSVCKQLLWRRYALGVDIFQVMFVKIISSIYNKPQAGDAVLEKLGGSRKAVKELCEQESKNSDLMLSFAKHISNNNTADVIRILRKYVYGADIIERAIREYDE